jgi:hypothetical protein
MFILLVLEVPGSNLDVETGYPECVLNFLEFIQANTGAVDCLNVCVDRFLPHFCNSLLTDHLNTWR